MPNEYYVTKNGIPCVLNYEIKLHWLGLLKQCELNEEPYVFGINYSEGKLKAERAIERTLRAAKTMDGSVIRDWGKIRWLTDTGNFEIQKRKVANVVKTETVTP